jgi:NAD(P)-dependent dehydrogenase (short-subunit alcohol dehydrogenase family)
MVAGGSGGIGKELSPILEKKYNVVSLSSSDMDITNPQQVNDICGSLRPDIVLNLSGINFDSFVHKLVGKEEQVNRLIQVNAIGAVNILSACLPHMRENKFGRIIMTSSVLARKIVVGTSLYSATKAFVDSMVKTTSAENISHGITCNSIRLGYFDAGMCHRIPEQLAEGIKNTIPLKRWGKIEELANTIDYLVNTQYITGQNIEISGGLE